MVTRFKSKAAMLAIGTIVAVVMSLAAASQSFREATSGRVAAPQGADKRKAANCPGGDCNVKKACTGRRV
ncbi:hypothetical protein JQ604_28910 [Bradyrhizobium jicamae]|uniref:hypothetical protein n=1 Tax=Bradyrhizobium jicamae TaxID=280332 RepID=UPI001BA53900|nr:hypothetical protein [Bradyrhizobium jicamae]MBR0756216.1 hypothetical protein [Bradyrhizobium jicamae]